MIIAKVQAVAVNGSVDATFADAVTLSSTDAKASLSSTALQFVGGVATFTATFNTAGNQTLKVSDTTAGSLVSPLTSSAISVAAPVMLPTVQLQTPAAVHVPSTGTTSVKIPVVLSATATSAITLTYETAHGTASGANGDYSSVTSATLTIPAGSKAGTYYITITGIKHVTTSGAYPKTFQVQINAVKNAMLKGSAAVTLTLVYP